MCPSRIINGWRPAAWHCLTKSVPGAHFACDRIFYFYAISIFIDIQVFLPFILRRRLYRLVSVNCYEMTPATVRMLETDIDSNHLFHLSEMTLQNKHPSQRSIVNKRTRRCLAGWKRKIKNDHEKPPATKDKHSQEFVTFEM